MSSPTDPAAPPPPQPAPSVFISYASEDRAAARALRDTLSAAGLEVWYDEQELTGGDAWDQKIRRQIRDCDYFMPVISATTEARKEGYFRREWRLATERTLDMADDVLFLLPVTIDDTAEIGARVPDKFLTVQWLRAPGGQATPAFHHLIHRLVAGDHHIQPRGSSTTRPPFAYQKTMAPFGPPPVIASAPGELDPHPNAPPPMPPFPHPPEKGGFFHGVKFMAEALWWALTAAWLLFRRLPKWARFVVTIWLVFSVLTPRCSIDPTPSRKTADFSSAEAQQAIKAAAEELAQAARDARKAGNTTELARVGREIARGLAPTPSTAPGTPSGTGAPGGREGSGGREGPGGRDGGPGGGRDASALSKRLVLVPFTRTTNASETPAEKFASAVFASLYGQVTLTHARDVGLLRQSPAGTADTVLIARAKQLGDNFILAGRLAPEGQPPALVVRLLDTEAGGVKWTESYPVADAEPTETADKIAEKLSDVFPPRRGGPPQRPFNGPPPAP